MVCDRVSNWCGRVTILQPFKPIDVVFGKTQEHPLATKPCRTSPTPRFELKSIRSIEPLIRIPPARNPVMKVRGEGHSPIRHDLHAALTLMGAPKFSFSPSCHSGSGPLAHAQAQRAALATRNNGEYVGCGDLLGMPAEASELFLTLNACCIGEISVEGEIDILDLRVNRMMQSFHWLCAGRNGIERRLHLR